MIRIKRQSNSLYELEQTLIRDRNNDDSADVSESIETTSRTTENTNNTNKIRFRNKFDPRERRNLAQQRNDYAFITYNLFVFWAKKTLILLLVLAFSFLLLAFAQRLPYKIVVNKNNIFEYGTFRFTVNQYEIKFEQTANDVSSMRLFQNWDLFRILGSLNMYNKYTEKEDEYKVFLSIQQRQMNDCYVIFYLSQKDIV